MRSRLRRRARASASSGSACLRQQVERRAVAEEIGFVVEQRLDHLARQARLPAHDEDGDQLVERGDAALAQQRRQARSRSASGGSSSVAGRCALRAGRRGSGSSCRLLARAPPRRASAMRRASLSGGRTAQARPASSDRARHAPDGAAGFVLGDDRAAARRPARAAPSTPSRPMPVRTTPSAAGAEHRADRGEHRIDRGQAAARRRVCGRGGRPAASPTRSTVRCASPGAMTIRSGKQRHAVLGDQRLAAGGDRRAGARTPS